MNAVLFFCVFFCVVSFVSGATCGDGSLLNEFGFFFSELNRSVCASERNMFDCTCSWISATNASEKVLIDVVEEERQTFNATLGCPGQPFCYYNNTLQSFVENQGICGNCGYSGDPPADWYCLFGSCALQYFLIASVAIVVLAVCSAMIYCFAINRKVDHRQNFQQL